MSQIYKDRATGPVPPTVITQITTDVRDNTTTGPGTVIPAANNVNILGRDTTQNNDNGIRSDADANNSANCYIELTNRATGTVTTADATLTTIITLTLGASAGAYFIWGNSQAFNSTTPAAGTYSYSAGIRTDGVTATVLGTQFHDDFEDPSLVTADVFINVSGNTVLVQVQGVAATSLNWNTMIEYRQVN